MSESVATSAGNTRDFDWLRVESMRLMDENADPEYGICGNEWLIVEQLHEAEETDSTVEILNALRSCECPQVVEMANDMFENSLDS